MSSTFPHPLRWNKSRRRAATARKKNSRRSLLRSARRELHLEQLEDRRLLAVTQISQEFVEHTASTESTAVPGHFIDVALGPAADAGVIPYTAIEGDGAGLSIFRQKFAVDSDRITQVDDDGAGPLAARAVLPGENFLLVEVDATAGFGLADPRIDGLDMQAGTSVGASQLPDGRTRVLASYTRNNGELLYSEIIVDTAAKQIDSFRGAVSTNVTVSGNFTVTNGEFIAYAVNTAMGTGINLYNVDTGAVTSTGLDSADSDIEGAFFGTVTINGDLLTFTSPEREPVGGPSPVPGVDHNGDGDYTDLVIRYIDLNDSLTPQLGPTIDEDVNFGDAGYLVGSDGRHIAYVLPEIDFAPTPPPPLDSPNDLNLDGDNSDFILHYFDTAGTDNPGTLQDERITNTMGAVGGIVGGFAGEPSTGIAPFETAETSVGFLGIDYNSDGDKDDSQLHFYDHSSQRLVQTNVTLDDFDVIGISTEHTRGSGSANGGWNTDGTIIAYAAQIQGQDDEIRFIRLSEGASASPTAPEITSLSVDQAMIFENDSVSLTGIFTDPNVGDEHTVTIGWGDGTVQNVVLPVGDRSFAVSHQYLDDGGSPGNGIVQDDYAIGVTVTDSAGGSDSSIPDPTGISFDSVFQLGSTGNDGIGDLYADSDGSVFVTGQFSGTVDFDPSTAGSFPMTSIGSQDIFAAKYDSTGTPIWVRQMGGASVGSFVAGNQITLDSSGNIYIAAAFTGTVDFDPGTGLFNMASNGTAYEGSNAAVVKLDANGDFVWARRFSGARTQAISVELDSTSDVYVGGWWWGTADFDNTAATPDDTLSSSGSQDGYVTKLTANGDFVWVRGIGGFAQDDGHDIAIDSLDNVYLSGFFRYTVDFDRTAVTAGDTKSSNGSSDSFLLKLNSTGAFQWVRTWGGSFNDSNIRDSVWGVDVDSADNVYTTGSFDITSGPVDFDQTASHPGNVDILPGAGNHDSFVMKHDSAGNFVWVLGVGGSGFDSANAITVDADGFVYAVGTNSSSNFDADPDPVEPLIQPSAGSADIYLLKLDSTGDLAFAGQMGGAAYDQATSITIAPDSSIITTGYLQSAPGDFDPTAGIFNLSSSGSNDAFVSVLAQGVPNPVVTVKNVEPVGAGQNYTTNEDTPLSLNVLSGTDDGGSFAATDVGTLDVLTAVAGTFPTAQGGSVTIAANGAATYSPAADFFGTDSFTYTVQDDDAGLDIATVTLAVNPVNDAPTLSTPGPQTANEDTTLNVLPAITVDDVDSNNLWVTLSVSGGTLTLGTTTGLTFLGATSNGQSTLAIEGSKVDLNAALTTLSYQGDLGFSGADTLKASVFDSTTYNYVGTTLSGGAPYNGGHIEGAVTLNPAQLALMAGSGGQSVTTSFGGAGDFVQSYTMTIVGPNLNFDTPTYTNFNISVDGNLDFTLARLGIEAHVGRGNPTYPELLYVGATSPDSRDLVGDDDTSTDTTLWFLVGPYALSGTSGTWSSASSASGNVAITVNPVNDPPVAAAGGPYSVAEGSSVTLDGSGSTDPENNIVSYAWDLDNDGQYDDATGVSPTFSSTVDGVYTIGLRVTDDDDATSTATSTVTVNNVAPVITSLTVPASGNEGDTLSFSSTATDAGTLDVLTFQWDFGDGTPAVSGANATHVYADNGAYTVTLTVTDDDGDSSASSAVTTIQNVAPTLDALSVTPMINENESATLTGTIVDPGTLDTFTLDLDWGDPLSPNNAQSFALAGAPLTKAVDGIDWNPATRVFSVDHQYLDDNPSVTPQDNYTINLTVTDDDGGTSVSQPADLLSWWPAEGDATDVADGNDGTLHNGATFAPGQVGQAFSFDGVDDYVDTNTNTLLVGTNSWTVGTWVNTTDDSGYIASTMRTTAGDPDLDKGMVMAVAATNKFVGFIGLGTGAYRSVTSTTDINDGNWHHVALVRSAASGPGSLKLFVDGVEEDATDAANYDITTSYTLKIGAEANLRNLPTEFYAGLIDELQVFTRALTDVEIQSLSAGLSSPMVTVKNVDPEFANVSTTSMIDENGTATLTGEVVDSGTIDTFTLDLDWGDPLSPNDTQSFALAGTVLTKAADGIDWNPATRAFSVDHQYLDDNPTATPQDNYTISISVTDDDGGTSATSGTGFAFGIGSSGDDFGNATTIDAAGNVYVTGHFHSTVDFDPDPGSTVDLTSLGTGEAVYVAKYSASGDLIWARAVDGSGGARAFSHMVEVDDSGNVFLSASFSGTMDFDPDPAPSATFNMTSTGTSFEGANAFVLKLDSVGDFVWARQFTSNRSLGRGVKIGSDGSVYTGGEFWGSVDLDPGAFSAVFSTAGSADSYIVKLTPAGELVWARATGGSFQDAPTQLALDASDNVLQTGFFRSTVDFDRTTTYGDNRDLLTSNGSSDAFLLQLDSNGDFQWARSWGFSTHDFNIRDIGTGVATDAAGNVYTAGIFEGTVDFDPTAAHAGNVDIATAVGPNDAFLTKHDSAGNFLWVRDMGGSSTEHMTSQIAVETGGNVHVTGGFQGTGDFDRTASYGDNRDQLSSTGVMDIFVVTLDNSGGFVQAQAMGGSGNDLGNGIAVDASGNIITTGGFDSTPADFDPGVDANHVNTNGVRDAFLVKLAQGTAGPVVTVKNVAPVGADQDYTTDEDVQKVFNVIAGIDDGGPFAVSDQGTLDTHMAVAGTFPTTQGGSVTITTDGDTTYTPAADFFGSDSFDYTVKDDDTGSDVAAVTITVDPVNDAPQAEDDDFTTPEDVAPLIATTELLSNDSDLDGDTLTITSVSDPVNGSVELIAPIGGYQVQQIYGVQSGHFSQAAVTPDGKTLYVTGGDSSNVVSVIDVASRQPSNVISLPGAWSTRAIAITPAGSPYLPRAYVGRRSGPIDVIDLDPNSATYHQVVKSISNWGQLNGNPANGQPDVMVFTPDGSKVYVTNEMAPNPVTVIDAASEEVLKKINFGAIGFSQAAGYGVDVSPDGTRVYVNHSGKGIGVIDTQTDTPIANIDLTPVNTSSSGRIAVTRDGTRAYVGHWDYKVSVSDLVNNVALTTIAIPDHGHWTAGSPSRDEIWVGNGSHIIDADLLSPTYNTVVQSISGGGGYTGIAFSPDGSEVYTAYPGVKVITAPKPDIRFTPTPDFYGEASFEYTVSDGHGGLDTAVVNITVSPVNDRPVLATIGNKILDEETLLTFTVTATDPNDVPANNVTLSATGLPTGASFTPATGAFSWTPTEAQQGSYNVTFTATDDGSGPLSDSEIVTITVNEVNDAPVLDAIGAKSVNEEVLLSFTVTAGDPYDVPANNVTLSATGLPTGASFTPATGAFSWTPTEAQQGSYDVTFTATDDGSGPLSDSEIVTITVNAVNDMPSFTKGAGQSVLEDAGAQTIVAWATAIDDGDPEVTQSLTFNVTNDNNSLFSMQPAVAANGTLSYTPAANANGSATVTLALTDDNTAGGAALTTAAQTFTISVTSVNDEPSFTKGADESVLEDAGAQTVVGWATAIDDGDPEVTQTLTFNVSNDNNSLFLVQPTVAATGTLSYTPAADANGSATVTLTLTDDNTAGSAALTTGAQTFTITVDAVNDAPFFTAGADESVLEDAGAQTVSGWGTAIDDGDPEVNQTLIFNVTNDNNGLFSVQPTIDASGQLTYTPAADANGSATVTVNLSDNGGGTDTSADQTFVINVTAVNDAPSFTKGGDQTVLEDSAAQMVAGWATALSAGPADESGQTLTFNVSNDNNALFSAQPAIDASGQLTYTPAADANGSATVTVSLSDDGGGADTSADQTFTITVNAVNDTPEITYLSLDQTMIFENESVTLDGNFADPDIGDEHTVTIDWGDGTVQVETLTIGDRSFSFPHQYLDDNPNVTSQDDYNVRVSVIDDDSACVNQPAGLVSWWRGEGSGDDLIGGQTVVAQGAATFGSSQVGQGFEMTAAGDAFHAPDSPIWHLQEFTVDAWVNATEARNSGGGLNTDALGGVVAVKVNNDFPHSGPDYNSWWISYQPLTGQFSTLVGPTTVAYLQSATGFAAGQFHHVAMTYDGQDLKLYVNGTFQGQKSIGQPIQYGSARLGIGGHAFGNFPFDRTLIGTVDEVQIFNGELTLQEISDIYNAGNAGKCATATTQVTVKNVNPVAADQDYTTDEDVQISFNVLVGTDDSGPFTVTDQGTLDTHTAVAGTFPTTQGGSVTIATNGTATYTPDPDFFGTDTFDFTVVDDDTGSDIGTVTIDVDAVNDEPTFTATNPPAVNEDAGAQAVNGWAAFNPGPANESGQSVLAYTVSNISNASLFAVAPSVDASGNLTYTPAANVNGTSTFDVQVQDDGGTANGGDDASQSQQFTITVNAINDEPSFTASNPPAVNEDAGAQTANGWAVFAPGAANESGQSVLAYTVSNISNPSLFAVAPGVDASGNLTYTPAANANGASTFDLQVQDDGGTSNGGDDTSQVQQFTVTVNAVNDEPAFTAANPPAVNEDDGAQTVNGWAVFDPGAANESGQSVLAYTVSNISNPSLFAVAPSVDASGNLTYTPTADANGTATFDVQVQDDGGTANGGDDTSQVQQFTITVNAVNDEPTFTASNPPAVDEDAGAQTVNGWAAFDPGAANESGQNVLAYTVTNINNASLFAVAPSIDGSGNLTYTPAAEANGTSTFDIAVQDNSGTPNGGDDTSQTQQFTIIVDAVNDEPTFVASTPPTVNEDAGAQSLNGWAVFDPGAANESGQSVLVYPVSNISNASLFDVAPSVDVSGNLTYTPAADANGTSTFDVQVQDNGGTANSGDDTSQAQQFTITVNPVNDEPSFAATDPPAVDQDLGPQTILSWATFDPGPANESAQTATYAVSNIGNAALFSAAPTVAANGTLTYTSAPGASGTSTFDVQVQDDGGTANGGNDSSTIQTFTITVDPTKALQQLQNLADDIQALIDGGGLSHKDGDKLLKRLDKATEKLAEAKNDKVIKELEKFIKDVDKLSDKGKLDPAAAQALIDAANDAIASAAIVVPQQLSQQIIGDVQSLVDTNILSSKDGGKLIKELGKAVDEFDQNKGDKGIKNLEKFIDKVVDLMDDGDLTPAQGQPLIDAANAAIQSALPGSPLMAASAAPSQVPVEALTSSQLDLVVGQARDYWYTNGASDADMARLSQIPIYVANLPGRYLGAASPDAVWFDQDASGYGWSVDSGSPGRMDLLNAVTHEFGHVLGFEHDEASIMNSTLEVAFRHDAVAPYDGALQSEFSRDLGAQIDTRTLGIEGIHGRDETVRLEILDEAVGSIASGWPFAATERSAFSPRRLSVIGKIAGSEEEDEQTVDRDLLAADNVDSVFDTF